MGDRCYLEVWVKKEHIEEFLTMTQGMEVDGGDVSKGGFVRLVAESYNHGFPEIDDFEKSGLVFVGSHSRGDEYPGAEFASDGTDTAYLYGENDEYYVSFNDQGDPDAGNLASVKKRLLLIRKVTHWAHQSDLEKLADSPNTPLIPEKETA